MKSTRLAIFTIFVMAPFFIMAPFVYPQGPLRPPLTSGPFNDETWGAVSDDGLTFEILPGPFFKQASVPDALELSNDGPCGKKGTLLIYYCDFSRMMSPGGERISYASSTDGQNWSEAIPTVFEGKRNKGGIVDPSVIELPDGRVRLYFFGPETTSGDPGKQEGDHVIYSAISSDAIHFQVEDGERFKLPRITDPEVVYVGGEWLMFLSRGRETLLARSNDGLNFTLDEDFILNIGGVPGAVVLPDGKIRIFACSMGIVSAIYNPETKKPPITERGYRLQGQQGTIVADPSPIYRLDGSYYLIFKKNIPHQGQKGMRLPPLK